MPWVHQLSRASIKRQGFLPWAVALLFFAISLEARLVLPPVLIGLAFITFYPAIVATTLICDSAAEDEEMAALSHNISKRRK